MSDKTASVSARITPETKAKLKKYGLTTGFILNTLIEDKELLNRLIDKKEELLIQQLNEKRNKINKD